MQLIDQYGRRVRKLRVSLTDKCNLRCQYCMPVDAKFMSEDRYLEADQCIEIVRELTNYGLEEIRLTGGEPLVRKGFSEIVSRLSVLPLKKIGMTTNAILLDRNLKTLKDGRVLNLNISLDSLDDLNFHKITRGNHLKRVLRNIELAKSEEFSIKLNVVAMRGVNDHEIFDFIEYSAQTGIEVRFLEVMRIGHAREDQQKQFISAQEMINVLKTRYTLSPIRKESDSTSFNYQLNNGAQVGFIASESKAFCGACSRWRLSADGMLRACLLKDDGVTLKHTSADERALIYQRVLGMKPAMRPVEVSHSMNAIGG